MVLILLKKIISVVNQQQQINQQLELFFLKKNINGKKSRTDLLQTKKQNRKLHGNSLVTSHEKKKSNAAWTEWNATFSFLIIFFFWISPLSWFPFYVSFAVVYLPPLLSLLLLLVCS